MYIHITHYVDISICTNAQIYTEKLASSLASDGTAQQSQAAAAAAAVAGRGCRIESGADAAWLVYCVYKYMNTSRQGLEEKEKERKRGREEKRARERVSVTGLVVAQR